MLDFGKIVPDLPYIFDGIFVTLRYTFISLLLGLVFGGLVAWGQICRFSWLRILTSFYTSVIRGTPLLLQLGIVYYSWDQLTGSNISAFAAGVLTFSLNSSAYVAEILKGGIQGIDKGQMEAATSLNLSYAQSMLYVIIPQVLRSVIPALLNELANLMKETTVISVVTGEADLFFRAKIVSAEKYLYFEPLIIAAGCYYTMFMLFSWVARIYNNKLKVGA